MITALFDGNCVICQSTRRVINTLDWFKRVEFLDLHSAEVSQRYPDLDHDDLMGEIHVIEDGGRVFAGFDGTRRMLKEVPLGFPLWLIMQVPGMPRVGRRIYGSIARNRYKINRFFGVELDETSGKQQDADCADGYCKIPSE
jgi:predicted DCC family thiol-disulfide oxidoreductase YuxK